MRAFVKPIRTARSSRPNPIKFDSGLKRCLESSSKNANIARYIFGQMIEFLKISNLALLEGANIEFSDGFTAVTGETGAGKSVMLGALSLLAGNRCGREIIREGADTCKVEALLSFPDTSEIDAFLEENGLGKCEDNTLVLARTISREKSGRAFVNGTLAPLSALAELGSKWIDFHGPREPQKLFSLKNQLAMLDNFCGCGQAKEKYLSLYKERAAVLADIQSLKSSKKLTPSEIEFLRSQIDSIDALDPTDENIAELEQTSKTAEMASEIAEKSNAIYDLIEGENGATSAMAQANRLASDLDAAGENAANLTRRLENVSVELSDIAEEYERLARSCDMSEEEIASVRARMSDWLSLSRKYGASPELVRAARDEMARKIEMQSDVGASIKKLEEREAEILEALKPVAAEILKARKSGAKKLAQEAGKVLERLGFKNASFTIAVEAQSEPSPDCGSACEFLFSANAGKSAQPLAKIASSGELARVMLALKTVLAQADGTPVLVFDEVDANVGGEIGAEVGRELAKLAENRQVFCVTHLPQVAAQAHSHFLVEKTQTQNSTSVSITQIAGDKRRRISELARMIGDRTSDSAIAHAQKLLDNAANGI